MRKLIFSGGCLLLALSSLPAYAQFNLDGQLIQRTEYKNGYGRLIPVGADPAAFIAHRARLQASYQKSSFTFYASIQDVRTWGNTPQIKLTDNNLSLHEAWLEMNVSEKWKVKLGRQELNYDNARFLGNLDWALQGRAHDFALVKYEGEKTKLQLGGGYNQEGMPLAGNTFTIQNQYKTAQMARLEQNLGPVQLSLLFWNDGRQYVQTGPPARKGIYHRQTFGIPTLRYQKGKTTFSGFYYHQTGKDPAGRKVDGFDASVQVTQQVDIDTAAGRKWRITGGFELLSGTPNNNPTVNRSFLPLYGTNHAHNGYMDLFYVGGAHENNVGLKDYFVRTRFDFNRRFFTQLDGHLFAAQANVFNTIGERLDSELGTELDLTLGFLVNDAISVQGGYSRFFYSDTFTFIQNINTPKEIQHWAYLMLVFRPNIKNKFIGILL